MPAEVKNTGNMERRIQAVQDNIAAEFSRLLPILRREIVERTRAGQAADGGAFAPYSQAYAKAKAAALGSANPVNLTVSGAMLDSIRTTVSNDRRGVFGTIEVTGDFNRNKAVWNQGGNPDIPARRFMALTDEQKSRIRAVIKNAIDKAVGA